nr:ribonuclease III [Geobacter sp. DSM 9736]
MEADPEKLFELQDLIGHRFTDCSLLVEALTHRSFINETTDRETRDNERLEFFGDTVLDFFLSQLLLELFPESREGELTKIRASLVDEDSLAMVARSVGIGSVLRLGRGEERSGGRERKSILADAYEALLAAVYLDGGPEPARVLVKKHLQFLLDKRQSVAAQDFKTDLQELTQSRFGTAPKYMLRKTEGPDHDRTFTVAVFVGARCIGEGKGRSKKEAEQKAASKGIELLKRESE